MKLWMVVIGALLVPVGCRNDGDSSGDKSHLGDAGDADDADDLEIVEEAEFTVDVSLASDDNPAAPGTVGIVTFSIDDVDETAGEIHFGLTADYGMTAPVDMAASDHRTLLLGMKPNREYHFEIVVTDGSKQYRSGDDVLETGSASNLVNTTSSINDEERHEKGFILSTQLQGTPSIDDYELASMVFILDGEGDVVWWYQSRIGRTSRAHLSHDGKAIWLVPDRGNFDSAAVERVSLDTLESRLYEDVGASHDGVPVADGVLAYIDYGEEDCGSVFELDTDGEAVEIFESGDFLTDMAPPECHMNAIQYYEDEGLYSVSDRDNDIFVINRNGEMQWRLSESVDNDLYGAQQHGHQLLENSILLFTNIGGELGTSAVIEYSLPDGEEIFRYESGVTSIFLGDVQRLPGGNTLVTYSIAGQIHEVDAGGEKVMQVTGSGGAFGYARWYASLYGGFAFAPS